MEQYQILGIMSGTSLDGVDLAYCRFHKINQEWNYEIVSSKTEPYPNSLKEKLRTAVTMPGLELKELDVLLGNHIAQSVNRFLVETGLTPDYIASHGHTIFHQPQNRYTLQIGNGATIAAETGISTICDFRSLDVALGGQGAPLVPIGDELLFGQYDACLNLGGFSNISYRHNHKRVAFDISPCNLPLNMLAQQMELEYDCDGQNASSGIVNEELLLQLDNLEYYKMNTPKSLGFEWLRDHFQPCVQEIELPIPDKLATVTEHITRQIGDVLNSLSGNRVLVTGGGAKNKHLIKSISVISNKEIVIPDEQLVDQKEALVFAFLGLLRILGEKNCLASVTGARKDSCSGVVYHAIK